MNCKIVPQYAWSDPIDDVLDGPRELASVRETVDRELKAEMMQSLIRDEAAFRDVHNQLRCDHFDGKSERHLQLVLAASEFHYQLHGRLPDKRALEMLVGASVSGQDSASDAAAIADARAFIARTFRRNSGTLAPLMAVQRAKQLAQQIARQSAVETLVSGSNRDESSQDPLEAVRAPAVELDVSAAVEKASREMINVPTLLQANYRRGWLVKDILVANEPAVVGGQFKTLKTSVLVDLAVSLAFRKPFLDRFEVPNYRRVGLVSAESGEATLQETVARVLHSKNLTGVFSRRHQLRLSFRGFKLGDPEELASLGEMIRNYQLNVLILDPLYLMLLGGRGKGVNPASLYDMGPLFLDVARTCLDAGCTPILCHHATKHSGKRDEPLTLQNLAFAGICEFARQWLLLKRREAYQQDGIHKLTVSVGGSAGHAGCYALDVDEGRLDENFGGRTWNVKVSCDQERRAAGKDAKAAARGDGLFGNLLPAARIEAALEAFPEGETMNKIAEFAHVSCASTRRILDQMVETNKAVRCQVTKAGRSHDGYRPVECQATSLAAETHVAETGDASYGDVAQHQATFGNNHRQGGRTRVPH